MDSMATRRMTARRMVLAHLRHRAMVAAAAPRPLAYDEREDVPLAMGFPGVTVLPDGTVAIDGMPCTPQPRGLSDLLSTGSAHDLYLADRAAVTTKHRDCGYDPVLYHAFRAFLPPRHMDSDLRVPADSPGYDDATGCGFLSADLVVYQPGTLPGGEPFRSTGHWNLPNQLEIFQTLTGRVAMLVGGRTRTGRPFLYQQVCGPGEAMVVPFEAWHVTYVLSGPAVVFNVTTTSAGGDRRGQPGAQPNGAKYRRAQPLAVTVRQRGDRHEFVGSPAALRTWGRPGGPPRADWLRPWLGPGESLADLHLYASPAHLASLRHAAREAYQREWPIGDGLKPGRDGAGP